MRQSCVSHPAHEPLVLIRAWQVSACRGNHCAAALLNFFEYWHGVALGRKEQAAKANAVAEMHGDRASQDETLLQWHTLKELRDGLLGLYSEDSISQAIKLLVSLKFIAITKNPNPRYHFDKTHFFQFLPESVQAWLDNRKLGNAEQEKPPQRPKNPLRVPENPSGSSNNEQTKQIVASHPLSEITTEITPEITSLVPETRKRARLHSPPDTLTPSPNLLAWHNKHWPDLDLAFSIESCLDHYRAKGKQAADFEAAVRTWERNSPKYGGVRNLANHPPVAPPLVSSPAPNSQDKHSSWQSAIEDIPEGERISVEEVHRLTASVFRQIAQGQSDTETTHGFAPGAPEPMTPRQAHVYGAKRQLARAFAKGEITAEQYRMSLTELGNRNGVESLAIGATPEETSQPISEK